MKIILSLVILILCTEALLANERERFFSDNPIEIEAKNLYLKRDKEEVIFVDNVIVIQDDTSLLADKMIVFYKETKKSSANKDSNISHIEAYGNVKIFARDVFVTGGEFGIYDADAGVFSIRGEDLIVNDNGSIIHGSEFIYDIIRKKSNIIGATKKKKKRRVTVIIDDNLENSSLKRTFKDKNGE